MNDDFEITPAMEAFEVWRQNAQRPLYITRTGLASMLEWHNPDELPWNGVASISGSVFSWEQVPGGLTMEEMVDKNLGQGS